MSKNSLNWVAVLAASFAWFALGGLWYSPLLFGPLWQELTGPSVLHQQPSAPMFIVPFVGALMGTTATAALVRALGLTTPRQAALLGLGLALTLVVPTVAIDAAAPNHPAPLTWTLVVGGYHVVGLVLVALAVTRFRGGTVRKTPLPASGERLGEGRSRAPGSQGTNGRTALP